MRKFSTLFVLLAFLTPLLAFGAQPANADTAAFPTEKKKPQPKPDPTPTPTPKPGPRDGGAD